MNKQHKMVRGIGLLLLSVAICFSLGCQKAEEAAEETGDAMEEAGEATMDAAEDAGEATMDAAEEMGDEIQDAADEVDDEM